jgi:hypothetical protein
VTSLRDQHKDKMNEDSEREDAEENKRSRPAAKSRPRTSFGVPGASAPETSEPAAKKRKKQQDEDAYEPSSEESASKAKSKSDAATSEESGAG